MKANVNATQKMYVMEIELSSTELEFIIKNCISDCSDTLKEFGKLLRETQQAHDKIATLQREI